LRAIPYRALLRGWAFWPKHLTLFPATKLRLVLCAGASYAFSRRPLSRAFSPLVGAILKGSKRVDSGPLVAEADVVLPLSWASVSGRVYAEG
jgi:hypothetical protein